MILVSAKKYTEQTVHRANRVDCDPLSPAGSCAGTGNVHLCLWLCHHHFLVLLPMMSGESSKLLTIIIKLEFSKRIWTDVPISPTSLLIFLEIQEQEHTRFPETYWKSQWKTCPWRFPIRRSFSSPQRPTWLHSHGSPLQNSWSIHTGYFMWDCEVTFRAWKNTCLWSRSHIKVFKYAKLPLADLTKDVEKKKKAWSKLKWFSVF